MPKAQEALVRTSKSPWNLKVALAMVAASLGSFNFGYNLASINTPRPVFEACKTETGFAFWEIPRPFPWECFRTDWMWWGIVVAAMAVGALIGSLVTTELANRRGRKFALLFENVFFVGGYLLLMGAWNATMLVAGRVLVGVGCGIACIAVPMYLAEIASVQVRGIVGSAHQMAIVTGLMFADIVGLCGLAAPFYWRLMLGGLGVVFSVGQVGLLLLCPESPRFLAHRQRLSESQKALMDLRQTAFSPAEFDEMVAQAAASNNTQSWSVPQLLKNHRVSGRSVLAAVFLLSAQQFSGINVVFNFSSTLFSSSQQGVAPFVPLIFSFLNWLFTFPGVWVSSNLGRRNILLASIGAVVVWGSLATVAFVAGSYVGSLCAVVAYVISFSVGLGPVPWLVANEVFPVHAHAAAGSLAVGSSWLSNMIVSFSFPLLKEALKDFVFVPYTVAMFFSLLFVYFMVPETRGRPLQFI